MKIKTMKQSDLTSDCWFIQMWGITMCDKCEVVDTDECGGQAIRDKLLLEAS